MRRINASIASIAAVHTDGARLLLYHTAVSQTCPLPIQPVTSYSTASLGGLQLYARHSATYPTQVPL